MSEDRTRGTAFAIWMEIENYYVQVLSGHRHRELIEVVAQRHSPSDTSRQKSLQHEWLSDFDTAIKSLRAFDMVVITEWLQEPVVMDWIFSVTGIDVKETNNRIATRDMRGTYKPADIDKFFTPADVELVYMLNQWDLKLYDFARKHTWDLIQRSRQGSTQLTGVDGNNCTCMASWVREWGEKQKRSIRKCGSKVVEREKQLRNEAPVGRGEVKATTALS